MKVISVIINDDEVDILIVALEIYQKRIMSFVLAEEARQLSLKISKLSEAAIEIPPAEPEELPNVSNASHYS
jgi:hypothetical protein